MIWDIIYSFASGTRAYYTERNRIIVVKRYFDKRDLVLYSVCILPFMGPSTWCTILLSTADGKLKTAASFLRGTLDGLRFQEGL